MYGSVFGLLCAPCLRGFRYFLEGEEINNAAGDAGSAQAVGSIAAVRPRIPGATCLEENFSYLVNVLEVCVLLLACARQAVHVADPSHGVLFLCFLLLLLWASGVEERAYQVFQLASAGAVEDWSGHVAG